MPFNILCRTCWRRLPKDLRHGYDHEYGERFDDLMLQVFRWLAANPPKARKRVRKAVA